MNLQQLRYFLVTARLGSFSAAGDELRLSQPGVSDQVRRLEAELGMPLFTRVGRGLRLTAAGETFVPYAEQVLTAVDAALESVAEVRTLRGGQVTFGLFRNSDYYLLPRLLAEFHAKYPDVRVRVLGQNSGQTAEDVREGRLEAALVAGPVDPSGLDIRPVMADEVVLASADPARVAAPVDIEQLTDGRLILYDAQFAYRDTTRRQLEEQAQQRGLKLEPLFDVEHVEGALALASQGLGDTLVARAITLHPSFPDNLHTASFAEPVHDRYVFLRRSDTPLTLPIRELAGIAERHMRDLEAKLAEVAAR
jgi:DNA-binding transcriptional LysR family regulator